MVHALLCAGLLRDLLLVILFLRPASAQSTCSCCNPLHCQPFIMVVTCKPCCVQARREYNNSVRELVQFIRKRDPRVPKVGKLI